MRRILVVAFLVFTLGACAPSAEEIALADYGPYPVEFEKIVKTHFSDILKDPYSARWEFDRQPIKGGHHILGKSVFGWLICGRVNAKNSFGAYIGKSMFTAVINNYRVVYADVDSGKSTFVARRCKKVYGF